MNLSGVKVVDNDNQALLSDPWKSRNDRDTNSIPSPGTYFEPIKDGTLVRSRSFRNSSRKFRKRAIFKNGECNVIQKNLDKKGIRYLQDIFTTLVDSQWRWTLLIFGSSFVSSWLLYSVLWWLIMLTHGDLEEMHLPNNAAENGWTPCVTQIYSFTSCFLFSIETQTTIGYGGRATTEECPEAIFLVIFQSVWGVMMQTFMAGIVFAKMTRSKQRTQTLLFSKSAVICQRDGELNLMFRIGDMRKSHIIGANVRAQLIRTKQTKEGELMSQYHTELEIGADDCGSDIFFIWPTLVVHRINEESPFYNMSAADLIQDKFEIVVILEGTVESTGQSTQARSSYLNNEILWGHRFDPVVSYNKNRQSYEVDYSKFDETIQVDTPLCSARELAEFYKIQDGFTTPVDIMKLFEDTHEYYQNLTVKSVDCIELLKSKDWKRLIKNQNGHPTDSTSFKSTSISTRSWPEWDFSAS
ncbi:G protein-activated inward rectifier potassium channel 3 isoform X2 [Condylostylus longicornis]|uniref:G protein-activated inward rectifier potassium channel 3 isoform X2 n=1 Tax=Condylostylus longicornis TaxID=2530218 RepID=UPI00244DDBA5|nr:G protein-activated inward rectifier potassium channel 3 isoform X2 [Condylostylus longicornis]